ncbi:MAG: hypothetical protein SO454_05430, partial [Candidatus Choladocola sp.]|nr:hypothetical protein [Candidatus Choladocola sp.]
MALIFVLILYLDDYVSFIKFVNVRLVFFCLLNCLIQVIIIATVEISDLFDEHGYIYSGSVPKYFGYNFYSGEQMGYFKPMLENKSLTMCQDVTPNTSEAKEMMYAITWNEDGTKMIQVGIEPKRLLDEIEQNT